MFNSLVIRFGSAPIAIAIKVAMSARLTLRGGIALANARLHDVVHEPAIANLGLVDIKFLLAMSEDRHQSKTSEIARRLGKKSSELSSVRARLLSREVIRAPMRGYVSFAVPDLGEYLREIQDEILARY